METEELRKKFISYVEEKILFYIESRLWSSIQTSQFRLWFNNFNSINEKYFACKLLNHFIFYNEHDLKHLCEYGLFDLIVRRHLVKKDFQSNLKLSNEEWEKNKTEKIKQIALMPLVDEESQSPTDSSRAVIARIFSVDLAFPDDQIISIEKIEDAILKNGIKHIIIIDDFIGSGHQIDSFWNKRKVNFNSQYNTLNEIANFHPDVEFEYLCLVATSYGLGKIKHSIGSNLRITFCEELTEEYRVFGSKSIYLEQNEITECKKILEQLCTANNFRLLGYDDLDYAIAFHHSIPDTSLRIFWKKNSNINNLFRNKQTEPTYV